MLLEIQGRQSKRKTARRKYDQVQEEAPAIDLDDKEFNDKRKKLRKEYNAECQGVDADLDWLQAAIRLAIIDQFAIEGVRDPSEMMINDRIESYGRLARPHLSEANQATLSKEEERAAKQAEAEKKAEDEAVREEAEENQGVFPGMEAEVAKAKGKKAGKVKVSKVDEITDDDPFGFDQGEEQIPREETFVEPKEEDDDLAVFNDEPEATEKLPPADGQAEKEKKPAKNKKASTAKKPAGKAKKK